MKIAYMQVEVSSQISPNMHLSSQILAYGQTGSGKTYTMGSEAGSSNDTLGLIPRFLDAMFASLFDQKNKSVQSVLKSPSKSDSADANPQSPSLVGFKVSASFLEVYGEDIFDLLDDNDDRESLKLREKEDGEVFVVGLRKNPVVNAAAAMGVLNTGTMNRTTAAMLMNHTSSRSHAVFMIHLQQTTRTAEGVDITTSSNMTFVDLAGSERMKKVSCNVWNRNISNKNCWFRLTFLLIAVSRRVQRGKE
jgi:kinesin family protein 4/21/27